MDLASIKWWLALLVFGAGWGGARLALRSARKPSLSGRIGHANALASGIILGTGLLHMLPEAHESLRLSHPDYPVAFLLASLAFLLLLLIEHVLLAHRGHAHGDIAPHGKHELAGELAVHASDNRFAAYVLLVGLSIHSVLAGIALGAQTTWERALAILLAILAHKSTAGFALGISLSRNRVEAGLARSLVLAFASATPVGIAIGTLATSGLGQTLSGTFESVFSSLAGGTFLYIASLDMIGEEFSHGEEPFAKWCWAVAGLAIAASLPH